MNYEMKKMNSGKIITWVGIIVILFYGLSKILDFYNIGFDKYGSYFVFYVFIFISSLIIPTKYKHT